jgi:hypothetical protein
LPCGTIKNFLKKEETMKRKFGLTLLTLGMLIGLAACGTAAPAATDQPQTTSQAVSSGSLTSDQTGGTSLSTQLLLGTLKLEGTDQAVDADQARELLPLWKAVKSLSNSDTASSIEMEALYQQIQETMTEAQMQAISGFTFDGESMRTLMDNLGLQTGPGQGGTANNNTASQNSQRQVPPDGGGPGGPGMFPGGGPGEMGGGFQNMDAEQQATAEAMRNSAGNRLELMLLDPLINLLQERANQ